LFDSLETLEKILLDLKDGTVEYVNIHESDSPSKTPDEGVEEPKPKPVYKIKSQEFVIQKYLQKPLLIHGRKFDIRVWVLFN
jgi:hypothetical protein